MRVPQPQGNRGSLKWIQLVINDCPKLLDDEIKTLLNLPEDEKITWVSPLRQDDYAEYRDSAFLERLGLNPEHRSLPEFWPARGPQWDALGKGGNGQLFLVEAKAHIDELLSTGTQASEKSKSLISRSLDEVKEFLGVKSEVDWSQLFYQYTNRLAHLYWLRVINRLPAFLINLYFIKADMNGPKTSDEWRAALQVMRGVLGLGKQHKLSRYTLDVFLECGESQIIYWIKTVDLYLT